MSFTQRHLPHWIPDGADVFVTWRLAPSGTAWLQDLRVASIVANALLYGEAGRGFYQLHAWVIMPDHVHVVVQPSTEIATIMRWLKGRTSRTANRILGRTGMPFWQDESFDHWVRSTEELHDLVCYVENNPVRAGLVEDKEQWQWSSVGWGDRGQMVTG